MGVLSVAEILTKALPKGEWVHLAQVVELLRRVDPDFSAPSYGFEKLRFMLESEPGLIKLEKDETTYPPTYQCFLLGDYDEEDIPPPIERTEKVETSVQKETFKSLFSRYRGQAASEVFAHFPWNEDIGENWESPFRKLAEMAKPEMWNFQSPEYQVEGQEFIILRNYLNYTFVRLQQQGKIVYSEDKMRACINTGLQTVSEKDIYATFFINKRSEEFNQPRWTFYSFADSYSQKVIDFPTLPEVASYIQDSSDLVFDLSYDLEINVEHIVRENKDRLPEIFNGSERLAMTAIQGATEFLKEKIRRNYKVAIPHWYHGKIQLLLPLNIQSDEKADLALVADKDEKRGIYRIKTALTMDMAYIDARLICRPDRDWLNP